MKILVFLNLLQYNILKLALYDKIMSQKKFALEHATALVESGYSKLWSLEEIELSIVDSEQIRSKRTLERWISSISWLDTSNNSSKQFDESNRTAIKSVFETLVLKARKKRRSALFVKMHDLKDGNNLQQNNAKVLVAEDGKGAKRWCCLKDEKVSSFISGLTLLANNKPATFFPSGNLVASFRKLKKTVIDQEIELEIAHFNEVVSFHNYDLVENEAIKAIQSTKLSHLDRLEAESLYIIREAMTNANNPVMLYSIGKDSAVMLHLARKAFYPSAPPFPLMHVDTRWKFKAMYEFRDEMVKHSGMKLIVHINPDGVEKNINPFDHGAALHTDIMKTQGLKQALDLYGFDMAFGGARRDEEKSRAKERVFSFRSRSHSWDPKNQRPELWNLYNSRKSPGESLRVFPLSNWTELDIWQYIYKENIPIVPLYFAAERPVIARDNILIMVDDDRIKIKEGETIELKKVRFRTLGCYPLTGAVESTASNLEDIMLELLKSRTSERDGRMIDSDSNSSMEKKKKEGYF
jgi:sulfate adenylyltransferase subunit 2